VLQGPQGEMLRQLTRSDSRLSQVRRAIDWIRTHYTEACRVEHLAALTGMSVAAFYRHFRATTAMTPIQYRKRLRLLAARRLMLFEHRDVAGAASAVGYESASQFSREYARMFGLPPVRDLARFEVSASRVRLGGSRTGSPAPRTGLPPAHRRPDVRERHPHPPASSPTGASTHSMLRPPSGISGDRKADPAPSVARIRARSRSIAYSKKPATRPLADAPRTPPWLRR
jgi:AraC-like DNA-binding protein